MPCTYCSNPKHTRKDCGEISGDFDTYEKVSRLVRDEYVNRLTELGLVPGAVVRTYNRTDNFMQKFSEVAIKALGDVDMFSCYSGPGKKDFARETPTKEHIILDDDDDRMVTPTHCYEVVQASDESWSDDWVANQILDFESFKALFKGKKRHVGFEAEKIGCVVKKYTTHQESIDEMIARLNAEQENQKKKATIMKDEKSIYVVTATSHTDDYKRKYTNVETKTAISYETAISIAAHMFLERAQDYELFYDEEDTLESFASCVNEADEAGLAEAVYDFFMSNESLFHGEYVPMTFEVEITEQKAFSVASGDLKQIASELIESLED